MSGYSVAPPSSLRPAIAFVPQLLLPTRHATLPPPPSRGLLPPGRVRPESSCCSTSRTACDLPLHQFGCGLSASSGDTAMRYTLSSCTPLPCTLSPCTALPTAGLALASALPRRLRARPNRVRSRPASRLAAAARTRPSPGTPRAGPCCPRASPRHTAAPELHLHVQSCTPGRAVPAHAFARVLLQRLRQHRQRRALAPPGSRALAPFQCLLSSVHHQYCIAPPPALTQPPRCFHCCAPAPVRPTPAS
jgi:hypothetical protein